MARPKRVLTPPLSPAHSVEAAHVTGGNFARKKFRARSEQQTSGSMSATSVDQQSRESRTDTESPGPGSRDKLEVPAAASPRPDTYHSLDTEHIAKKKRAMFQVRSCVTCHAPRHLREAAAVSNSTINLFEKLPRIFQQSHILKQTC